MTRFIVGIDGSENSLDAARVAAVLATATKAPVVAVHAVGLLERLGRDRTRASSRLRHDEIAAKMESDWCAPLAGLEVQCRVVDGNPVSALLEAADRSDDLLVVGRRGVGANAGSALGSTSAQVVERARVPVVIVPEMK